MKEMTHMQKNLLIALSVLCVVYILSSLSGILNPTTSSISSSNVDIIVYKSETCGCCNDWIDHLEDNNFKNFINIQYNPTRAKSYQHRINNNTTTNPCFLVDTHMVMII